MEIQFAIREHLVPVSDNNMYMPVSRGKRPWMTKTKELKQFENRIDPILAKVITDEQVAQLKEELEDFKLGLVVEFRFGMSEVDFYRADAGNFIKSTEDALKYRLNVDDSRHVKVISEKYIYNNSTDDDDWLIEVHIHTKPLDYIIENKWVKGIK